MPKKSKSTKPAKSAKSKSLTKTLKSISPIPGSPGGPGGMSFQDSVNSQKKNININVCDIYWINCVNNKCLRNCLDI